jgi:hypothetical protein
MGLCMLRPMLVFYPLVSMSYLMSDSYALLGMVNIDLLLLPLPLPLPLPLLLLLRFLRLLVRVRV